MVEEGIAKGSLEGLVAMLRAAGELHDGDNIHVQEV